MKFLEYVEQIDNKDILPQGPLVRTHRVTESPLHIEWFPAKSQESSLCMSPASLCL